MNLFSKLTSYFSCLQSLRSQFNGDRLATNCRKPSQDITIMPSENTHHSTEPQIFNLFGLPPEVRDMIYGYSVVLPGPIKPKTRIDQRSSRYSQSINTSLFLVNRETQEALLKIFYERNTGVICDEWHRRHLQHYQRKFPVKESAEVTTKRISLYQELVRLGCASDEVYTLRTADLIRLVYPSMVRHFKTIQVRIDWLYPTFGTFIKGRLKNYCSCCSR